MEKSRLAHCSLLSIDENSLKISVTDLRRKCENYNLHGASPSYGTQLHFRNSLTLQRKPKLLIPKQIYGHCINENGCFFLVAYLHMI